MRGLEASVRWFLGTQTRSGRCRAGRDTVTARGGCSIQWPDGTASDGDTPAIVDDSAPVRDVAPAVGTAGTPVIPFPQPAPVWQTTARYIFSLERVRLAWF